MAQFMLEYRSRYRPELDGLWGPFDTRGAGDDFARALDGPGAAWAVISLRDPESYTFPEPD